MRTKKGQITSAKMTGTVTVTVHRSIFHPLYQKRFTRSKKFLADPGEHKDLIVGDTVLITECRPLSKNKCFRVTEVLERVPRVSELKEEEVIEKSIHREKKHTVHEKKSSSASSASSVSSASSKK